MRPSLRNQHNVELPKPYISAMQFLGAKGLETEVRALLNENGNILDRGIFQLNLDRECLCRGIKRVKFR